MSASYQLSLVVVFGIALVTAILLTPVARWIAAHYGMVDVPGGRRQHQGKIARLGAIPLGCFHRNCHNCPTHAR
ncbi:MAG: hypothetical protein U0528_03785 [Anaerolineae bacterium]